MKGLSLLFALLVSSSIFADEVGYEVEVIIFEDLTGFYKNSEKWSEEPDVVSGGLLSSSIKNEKNTESNKYLFENMELSESRLVDYAGKLKKHPDYNVLVHKKWKQTGLDNENAFPVSIDSRVKDEVIEGAIVKSEDSVSQMPEEQPDSSAMTSSYIDGEVTLIMSRYLHLQTNLIFHKPVNSLISSTYTNLPTEKISQFVDYKLNFERRMRSREIHYIDHPLAGIIVLAIPFKIKSDSDIESSEKTYKTL